MLLSMRLVHNRQTEQHVIDQGPRPIEQRQHIELPIPKANTLAQPLIMLIKAHHALPTHITMLTPKS